MPRQNASCYLMKEGEVISSSKRCRHSINNNMEQNQSTSPAVHSEIQQEQQWIQARNEFAAEDEVIGQAEDVAALVQKWIWIQHQQEFRNYQQELQEIQGSPSLDSIICSLLQEEKQEAWMINQRYTMEQINSIITKLRTRVREILKNTHNLNPEAQPLIEEPKESTPQSNQIDQEVIQEVKGQEVSKQSSILPQIKTKCRVYLPHQMNNSFHLLKSTQQDYQIQSLSMFAHIKAKEPPRPGIFNNKYLRQTFKWLCKQGYNYKGLFEDFSKEGDRMNLNKWMVFCKEFDFTGKFHKKDLVGIFQTATKFGSNMFIQDFLTAVSLLQDKYVDKFHKGEENFVGEVMHMDSQASYRVKMDNLKVNYSGPRKNFFQYASYHEHQRVQQIQRENEFKAKKHQRQIVLIKGMFEEHLKDEVQQRKVNREKLKASRVGSSLNMIEIKDKSEEKTTSHHTARIIGDLNYSKLFKINRGMQQELNSTTANTNFDKKMYRTDLTKIEVKTPRKMEHKRIDAESKKNHEEINKIQQQSRRYQVKSKQPQPINSIFSQKQEEKHLQSKSKVYKIAQEAAPERTWLTNIRSDSEQSDDILKQHMDFEKRVKETKVQVLMKQMESQSAQVQKIKEQIDMQNEENEEDQDMMETQAHFKKGINV